MPMPLVRIRTWAAEISVLILLKNSTDAALATNIAMHAAASNPKYVSRDEVPVELVEKEKEIYIDQLKQQGKPEAAMASILKGKLDKYYSEICLLSSPLLRTKKRQFCSFYQQAQLLVLWYGMN
jgi:elongation factor Ts